MDTRGHADALLEHACEMERRQPRLCRQFVEADVFRKPLSHELQRAPLCPWSKARPLPRKCIGWASRPAPSSPAECAANSLVNARMNKKRQMRWSPVIPHRVFQVRAAVADGRLRQA